MLPQKQLGLARFGAGPIIRKRICAPQQRFGHSHHSSRLFFTNVTSARFNAPRRCTCPLRAPSRCRQRFRPRVRFSPNSSLAIIWLFAEGVPRKKMLSAHDCDRRARGWFSSQTCPFPASKRIPGARSDQAVIWISFRLSVSSRIALNPGRFRLETANFGLLLVRRSIFTATLSWSLVDASAAALNLFQTRPGNFSARCVISSTVVVSLNP